MGGTGMREGRQQGSTASSEAGVTTGRSTPASVVGRAAPADRVAKAVASLKPVKLPLALPANLQQQLSSAAASPQEERQRTISEQDLQLFARGEHRRAHRFLGAHLVEDGVRFAAWAPNAARVSVVGSFNGWNPNSHPMQRRGDFGVWELFIPNLGHGFAYKLAVTGKDGKVAMRTDPFARFIENNLDRAPQFVETYYEFQHPKVPVADKLTCPLNVYEVHPLSWRHRNGRPLSYLELIDELVPYVKYMEYTHVELMGILEHPYIPSWGYQVIGFFAPTSRMGTPTDFKRLVDAFHREGIGVILDVVMVHFPKDATGLAHYDSANLFESPIPERKMTPWDTFYFDFARNEVRSFLISSLFHWIEEFYVDGFRFDAAGQFHYFEFGTEMKYRDFLRRYGNCHNAEGFRFMQSMTWAVKEEHPETLCIAEDSTIASGVTRPVEHGGHGFDYKWDLGCTSHMMKFFRAPFGNRSRAYNDLTYPMLYNHSENFLLPLAHDEVVHMKRTLLNKTEGLTDFDKFANLRLLYLVQFGYPHKKLLFMGQEFGQENEWNAEHALPWNSTWAHLHGSMQWYVKRLNEIYKYIPAMHQGDNIKGGFEWIECHGHKHNILAFIRYDKSYQDMAVYLINLSKDYFEEFSLGVPFAGKYCKILDTDAKEFGGNGHNWVTEYQTVPKSSFHHPRSISTKLLPLHGMIFRAVDVQR
jgi:1,4-alpha-glucan branching enzyme